jgi:hypothetical protein
MLRNLLAGLLLLAALAPAAQAQSVPVPPDADAAATAPSVNNQSPSRSNLGSPEAEMRERARIRHEEDSHRELRERADEAARLGAELHEAFTSGQGLGREAVKKLEKVEKLARQIRNGVGGSGDDSKLEDLPDNLGAAFSHLAELAGDLRQEVKKTSRHVVSASAIEQSNRLIWLVRHVRSLLPR